MNIRIAGPGDNKQFLSIDVPGDLQHIIVKDAMLSKVMQEADRSLVYRKVAAYTLNK
jgi:hypothetical protein